MTGWKKQVKQAISWTTYQHFR